MRDKIILIFMATLLAVNFLAWNAITTSNEKEIKKISRILESCKVGS
jgi:hypothetical protein